MEKFPRGKEGQPNEKQLVGVKRTLNQELLFGQSKRLKAIVVEKSTSTKKNRKLNAGFEISNNFDGIGRKVTAKDFTPNVVTLGVILSVNDGRAKVSLPNGYIGTLTLDDLLDEPLEDLSNCITPLQIVECCVLENSISALNKRHIVLSMNGARIYRGLALKHLSIGMQVSGIVVSEEDHGFLVQTGIAGIHCFLPRRVVGQARVSIGTYANYVIHEINEDTRVIQLYPFSALKERSPKAFPLSIQSIYPGCLLSVAVEKKTEFGLVVNYMDSFKGFIERSHLDKLYPSNEWKQFKPENSIVKARVLMVDKAEKWVKLTMRPHLLNLSQLERLPHLGSELESLRVLSRRESQEIYLVASNQEEKLSSNLFMIPPSEYEGESLEEGEGVGKVRILGYHLVEGVVVCSNRSEKLNDAILHFSQVQVGEKYSAKITEIKDFGLIVRINESVNVLCPLLHISDTVPTSGKLHKRFKLGQIVHVRIWEVNENGIIVTLKKSLVECSDSELLKAYDEVVLGKSFVGMVTITSENGLWIRFFNKVKAFIPKSIIEAQGINEAVSAFREGQILRVVALDYNRNVSPSNSKFIVCINMEIDDNKLEFYRRLLRPSPPNAEAKVGSHDFVSGFVTTINKDSCTITTDDGRLGTLEKFHLFDFSELFENTDIDSLGYTVGSRISNALVLDDQKEKLVLTLKPLLLKIALEEKSSTDSIPNDISDLHPGNMVAGYVRKVESYGVLVQFKNGLTAMAPRPSLSDRFITTPFGIFSLGNSVRCMVQRVDLQKQRIFVTFKPSLIPSLRPSVHSYLLEYLWEEYQLARSNRNSASLLQDLKSHKIGSVVEATVCSIEEYGVICRADNTSTFFLVKNSFDRLWTPQVGESRELLIIDVDFRSTVFIAIVIVDKRHLKRLKRGEKHPGGEFSGKIISVTKRYVVILTESILGYLPIADFHFPNPDSEQYQIGGTISSLTVPLNHVSAEFDFPHQHVQILSVSNVSNNTLSSKFTLDESADPDNVRNLFKIGKKVECKVKTVNKTEMVVEPLNYHSTEELTAIVHITAMINSNDGVNIDNLQQLLFEYETKCMTNTEISELHPFYNFRPGMKVDCVVVHIQKAEKYIVQLKPALNMQIKNEVVSYYGDHQIKANSSYDTIVTEVGATSCTIMFSPYVKTELPYCDVSRDIMVIRSFKNHCFIGLKTRVFVYSVDSDRRNPKKVSIGVSRALLEGSLLENQFFHTKVGSRYQQGETVVGVLDFRLHRLPNPPNFSVILPGGGLGRVCLTELVDQEFWMDLSLNLRKRDLEPEKIVIGNFKHGDIVECVVLHAEESFYEISLRRSRLDSASTVLDTFPNQGDVVKGFVTYVSEKGCFVRISNLTTGRVLLRDLSDSFVADPVQEFPIGRLVVARVLKVDSESKSVQLSLKPSVIAVSNISPMRIREGDLVHGIVHRVTDFGVFVKLNDSSLVGLSRKNFAVEGKGDRLSDLYEVGDVVKAKVLSVNFDGSKIALDLRRSTITQTEICPLEDFVTGTESGSAAKSSVTNNEALLSPDLPLSWQSQFVVSSMDDAAENREETGKQKKKSVRNTEMDVRAKELDLLEGKVAPQSVEEFERLVASNPNSSFVWIQYMSYYTQTADFESSKIIGKRALRTIHFREEQEKLNVWLALLSLEYKFGTAESLQSTFSEAIKENKAKSVYLGLALIYEKNGNFKAARTSLGIALKSSQFRKSKKIWIKYLEMILREGDSEGGKQELSRALQSLSSHKHVETISRYALLEYEYGSPSNARVLFEDLVASYPKRSDLWFVYIDQETKLSNVSHIRQLFHRMIAITFSGKVMKTVFKKFLAFEVQFGNETTQDQVKAKARAYVEKTK